MITIAQFMGGSFKVGAGPFSLNHRHARAYTMTSGNANLPDARLAPVGAALFYVYNNGSGADVLLKDNAGTTIATIPQNQVALVSLLVNTTAAGTWWARLSAYSQGGN